MTKLRKKFVLFACLAIGFGLSRFFLQERASDDQRKKYRKEAAPRLVKAKEVKLIQKEEAIPTTSRANKPTSDLKEMLTELSILEGKVADRAKECDQKIEELLPSDEFIDPEIDFFKEDPESVVALLGIVIRDSMQREVAKESFRKLKTITKDYDEVDPLEMEKKINFYGICRPQKAITFLWTALEASMVHNWSQVHKNRLKEAVLGFLGNGLSNHGYPQNIMFTISIVRNLIDYKLISGTYGEDLSDLERRINEQYTLFEGVFGEEYAREKNISALREHIFMNEDFARELSEIIRQYRGR